MPLSQRDPSTSSTVEVPPHQRWAIYHRLQELDIPCWCKPYQPLQVQFDHAIAVIQFWQVSRRAIASRSEQAQWLETCWQLPAASTSSQG
ncbi:MAG: hypothetical protein VKK04_15905 [Synechococcales bacterium]|nr:hypothetical protein [Synechococcales bacterium]